MTIKKEQEIFGLPVLEDNIIWLWVNERSVVVIDPGVSDPVIDWIKKRELQIDTILLTHHHNDHIGGTEELLKEWPNTKVIASKKDKNRIPFQNISVKNGEFLNILNKQFLVIELVGHTNAHISFYSKEFLNPILFVGDTLFSGGCGRIFEGTYKQMHNSLKLISFLPMNTIIYCAHEYTKSNLLWALDLYPDDKPIKEKLIEVERKICTNKLTIPTTLKEEMEINLFLRAKNLDEFTYLRAKKDGVI
tara:strand:- start:1469 stop:2212 length:744 start_codon:yes stop_codon:yes gene_type:complete